MQDHELKCWPTFFGMVIAGLKKFEYRKNDRGFEAGDTLTLREWDPQTEKYTGRNVRLIVHAVFKSIPGLRDDFVIMDTSIVQAPWISK